jgi:hypothetical protein
MHRPLPGGTDRHHAFAVCAGSKRQVRASATLRLRRTEHSDSVNLAHHVASRQYCAGAAAVHAGYVLCGGDSARGIGGIDRAEHGFPHLRPVRVTRPLLLLRRAFVAGEGADGGRPQLPAGLHLPARPQRARRLLVWASRALARRNGATATDAPAGTGFPEADIGRGRWTSASVRPKRSGRSG